MKIAPPAQPDDPAWFALRSRLWPHLTEPEHRREAPLMLGRGDLVLLASDDHGNALGLVEAAKRVDYVNGTESSPVAFVEGLYVEPSGRRQGVARALIAQVETWARAQGCTEIASDSQLANLSSHAAHLALGFEETERVVYFRKIVRAI